MFAVILLYCTYPDMVSDIPLDLKKYFFTYYNVYNTLLKIYVFGSSYIYHAVTQF